MSAAGRERGVVRSAIRDGSYEGLGRPWTPPALEFYLGAVVDLRTTTAVCGSVTFI